MCTNSSERVEVRMGVIRYHLLAIFGGLILAAYSMLGTIGSERASVYQSALLLVGLVVAVALAFHLGMVWERRSNEPQPQ